MIVFADILNMLSERGWSQYRLVKERVFGNSTIQRMRLQESITTETIDKICELCECQPGDFMHYEPSNKGDAE